MEAARTGPGTSEDPPPPTLEFIGPLPAGSASSGNNTNIDISDSVSDSGDPKFTLHPDNAFYHKLTPSERITLAGKYVIVPPPADTNVRDNKKRKDKYEIVLEEKDRLMQSFPVHTTVQHAFDVYVDNFEKATYKSLTDTPSESTEGAAAPSLPVPQTLTGTPASNKYDIKSGFQIAPTIEKWDFKTHNRAIPQVVSFDGDLAHIKADSKTPNPSNVKLSDGEWGNLQKSASYALRAVSHAAWFRDAAVSALDEALPLIDPSLPQNAKCIETLIDVKQFLVGMEYAIDKLARYSVYPHAGITSLLRKEFLQNESKSILLEEQCKLFALPYGKSLVFQGMVHSVAPQVKQYRDESRANQQLEVNTKLLDQVAKTGKGGAGGGTGNSGFHNTRSTTKGTYQHNQSPCPHYQTRRSGYSKSPPRSKQPFPKSQGAGRGGGVTPTLSLPQEGSSAREGEGRKATDYNTDSDSDLDDTSVVENFTHLNYLTTLDNDSLESEFELPFFPVPLSAFDHLPVGDRMQVAYKNWESIGASDYIVSVLKHGYSLEFKSQPPLQVHPDPFYLNLTADQQFILDEEMQKFLDGHVIEPVLDLSTPGFYSPLFLHPKTDKGWRIIINISELNRHLVYHKFKMETLKTVRQSLKQGHYAFSLDLKSAYSHIPIHPASRKYLRFFWKGKCFQFRNLPFGLSPAPYLFSLTVSQVAKFFHSHGVFGHFYLDDWLFFLFSRAILSKNQPKILHVTALLGWIVNLEKSDLDISHFSVYIGGDFDLSLGTIKPTQKRWEKICMLLPPFLQLTVARAGHWASILGILTSTQDLTEIGRLQLRSLQYHVNLHWFDRENTNIMIPITAACKSALSWWLRHDNVMPGVPLQPPPANLTLFTDSSSTGYGASLNDMHFSGKWSTKQASHHINYLEMLCVKLSLIHFRKHLTHQVVLVASDNSTVVCYLNKQSGTHSFSLHELTYDILSWCLQEHVILRARHLAGKLNVIADGLSRDGRVLQTEWSLHPDVFSSITMTWSTPQIDLFATASNTKCPVYFSPIPDNQAAGIDALSQSWSRIIGYAFPPPGMLQLVLNKIQSSDHCQVLLVVPRWTRRSWFPQLLTLLNDVPRQLPCWPKLLKQPNQLVFHSNPQELDLHVCSLSSLPSENKGFLNKLRTECHTKPGTQLTVSTRATGINSVFGVLHGVTIPTYPLYKF